MRPCTFPENAPVEASDRRRRTASSSAASAGLIVTGYAGATVSDDFTGIRKDIHDNNSFGGQILTTAVEDLQFGLSFMRRRQEQDPYWTVRARDTKYQTNMVIYSEKPDGSRAIDEIRVGGTNSAIVFAD